MSIIFRSTEHAGTHMDAPNHLRNKEARKSLHNDKKLNKQEIKSKEGRKSLILVILPVFFKHHFQKKEIKTIVH